MVVLNDQIHYARNVLKTNTSNVQTFCQLNRGPAGLVNTGKITWFHAMDKKHGTTSEFSVQGLAALPRVDILYAYAEHGPRVDRRSGRGWRRRAWSSPGSATAT